MEQKITSYTIQQCFILLLQSWAITTTVLCLKATRFFIFQSWAWVYFKVGLGFQPQNFRATPFTYNFLKTFAYNPRVTVYVTLVKESLFITNEEKSPFKKKKLNV